MVSTLNFESGEDNCMFDPLVFGTLTMGVAGST